MRVRIFFGAQQRQDEPVDIRNAHVVVPGDERQRVGKGGSGGFVFPQHIMRHADAVARFDAHAVGTLTARVIVESGAKLEGVEIFGAAFAVGLDALRGQRNRARQRVDGLAEAQLPAERVRQRKETFIVFRLCAAGGDFRRVGKAVRQSAELTFTGRMDVGKIFSHAQTSEIADFLASK